MGNRRATGTPSTPKFPRDAWAAGVLERAGLLSARAREEIKRRMPEWAATVAVSHGAAPEDVSAALARAAKVAVGRPGETDQAAALFVPEAVARQYCAVPVAASDRRISIVTSNPLDLDAEQALAFVSGRQVEFLYALPEAVARRIDEVYRPERLIERIVDGLDEKVTVEPEGGGAEVRGRDAAVPGPVARLLDATIADAVREGASDVLFEPIENGLTVRYLVDGVARDVMTVPRSTSGALVRRIRALAQTAKPDGPHGGLATARVDGKQWELRLHRVESARPGEMVAVRLRDPSSGIVPLGALGLWPDELVAFESLLQNREGIVVVTGPAGSGRVTTLYAALDRVRAAGVAVAAVEEEAEYRMAGAIQIQPDERKGLTLAAALRSALRQGVGAVLVGGIRDPDTARTALEAGLSGRLVLAALDGDDSAAAIAQLLGLGLDGSRLAAALKGIVTQRLLRRLCPHCATPAAIDLLPPRGLGRPARPLAARGCARCMFTGYRGRLAIQESLTVTPAVAEAIGRHGAGEALIAELNRAGMETLSDAATRRAWAGETTFEEVKRVMGGAARPPGAAAPRPGVGASAAPGGAPPPPVPTPDVPAREPPLVLIADDDPAMRALVATILTGEGMRVAEAADGIAALDEAQRRRPALLLLDMDMPRLDGLGVLETLRRRLVGRSVPVVVVTAHDDPAIESRCIEMGAEDYMVKPIQPASLVARTRAVLRRVGNPWPRS